VTYTCYARPISPVTTDLPVGGIWVISVAMDAADDPPVVTVTLPGGSTATPSVESLGAGCYRVAYVVASTGRYVARAVTAGNGAVDFTCWVTATVAATGMPGLDDLRGDPDADPPTSGYLGVTSWTDEEIGDALDAEAAAQRSVCDVPAAYPADLRQALLRRVWRNLALRGQPFLTVPGSEDTQVSVVPSLDSEIRRLERPFRKLPMG
jgi:hypothetical protein